MSKGCTPMFNMRDRQWSVPPGIEGSQLLYVFRLRWLVVYLVRGYTGRIGNPMEYMWCLCVMPPGPRDELHYQLLKGHHLRVGYESWEVWSGKTLDKVQREALRRLRSLLKEKREEFYEARADYAAKLYSVMPTLIPPAFGWETFDDLQEENHEQEE